MGPLVRALFRENATALTLGRSGKIVSQLKRVLLTSA